MKKNKKKIFVAGHNGMVGAAITKLLKKKKIKVFTIDKKKLNLLESEKVLKYFKKNNFDQVYLCAARVGGINANIKNPYKFINQNLIIQNNIINSALITKVKRLIFLGSSCIYPVKNSKIYEKDLLNGSLEKTNEFYAVAKLAGIKLCQSINIEYDYEKYRYISIMPCNLFGPKDNYDLENGHVFAALLKKIIIAKRNNLNHIEVWGSGKPKREFLHSEDLASALYKLMNLPEKQIKKELPELLFNVGSGKEFTILKLAKVISKEIQFTGKIKFNRNYPDGVNRKILDSTKIKSLGWKPISINSRIKEHIRKIKI